MFHYSRDMTENCENLIEVEILFLTLTDKLNTFKTLYKDIQLEVKHIEKKVNKCLKQYKNKLEKKRKSKKAPSGFAQPTRITNELCNFLNITEGTRLARTEVTKSIINYIKTNNLQDSYNKKVITPDEKLRSLLGLDTDNIDYFSLQKYMNRHFVTGPGDLEIEVVEVEHI